MDIIESNIEDDKAENEKEDKDERKMPPKMRSPKKKATASSAAGTDATEDHLASAIMVTTKGGCTTLIIRILNLPRSSQKEA